MPYILKSEFKSKKLPQVINVNEFDKILEYTKKAHHRIAFKLGFLCGLRVSEVVKLKKEDIDLNRNHLFIQQGKGKRDRYVPIPKPLKKDLKKFPIKKIGVRALQKIFKKIAKKAINKNLRFHILRHSCATYYLNKGMNIRQVQMLLGHANIATTSIYLHVSLDELKNQVNEIWK